MNAIRKLLRVPRIAKLVFVMGALGLAVSSHAFASTYQGFVGSIVQEPASSSVYIEITNGSFVGNGSCEQTVFWILVNTTAATAPTTLALVMSAKEHSYPVYVIGDGVCSNGAPNNGVSEGLSVFYLD